MTPSKKNNQEFKINIFELVLFIYSLINFVLFYIKKIYMYMN